MDTIVPIDQKKSYQKAVRSATGGREGVLASSVRARFANIFQSVV